jgi:hypothetical protein
MSNVRPQAKHVRNRVPPPLGPSASARLWCVLPDMEGVVAASGVPHRCYGSPVPSLRGTDVAAKPGARRLHPLHPAARRDSCIRAVVPVATAVEDSSRRVRRCCSSGVGGAAAGIQKKGVPVRSNMSAQRRRPSAAPGLGRYTFGSL